MKSASFMAILGIMVMLLSITACTGKKGDKKARQSASPVTPSKAPAGLTPSAGGPAMKPGTALTPESPPKQAPFSPEMSAEFMRKVMETSARIEAIKKEIAERQRTIFETNPEVKAYREQMIGMQKEINRILNEDQELAELKLNRDMLWTTMPSLPKGNVQGGPLRSIRPAK